MKTSYSRVEQMKNVHIQAELYEYSKQYIHLSNNIEQINLIFNQIKEQLKIEKTNLSFDIRDDNAIKELFLSIHNITGKIISETKQISIEQVKNEALDLFARKNADYGDAFAEFGTLGVLVRIGDKIFRLNTLTKRKENEQMVSDESIIDTYEDLFNYTAMAVMLINE